jgi:hypothetical protein
VHPLPVAAVHAEDLDRLVTRRPEPVRYPRVELGDLARAHRDVVLAEDIVIYGLMPRLLRARVRLLRNAA